MSAWKDYATAALLGAGKTPLPPLPAPLEAVLGEAASMDEAARFLTQAGALALWRRSGWQPSRNTTEISPCEPESTAPLSGASASHLRAMLSSRGAAVLPEWLEAVSRVGQHVPPEFLPALLDRARQDRFLRPLVLAAGGRRAQWLTTHNPDWAFGAADAPDAWETGSRDQRVALLRALRETEPAEARHRVEAVWKTEPAEIRAAFLAELGTQLSDDDAAFLESALDDRSKEVRRVAVDLLARLPTSPFVVRMMARATPLLTFRQSGSLSGPTWEVTLPADPDAAATRDGLDPKAFGQQKELGEKAVLLVLILAAVPLRHWTDSLQLTPMGLLKSMEKHEFARALATGWAWAALRQRDVAWAEALLDSAAEPHPEFLPAEPLLALLPEEARATRLISQIQAGAMKNAGSAEWLSCLAELTGFAGRAPAPLVRETLAALRNSVASGLPWHLRSPIEEWLLHLPPKMLAEATTGWPVDQESIAPLVELLIFRHDALSALTQP